MTSHGLVSQQQLNELIMTGQEGKLLKVGGAEAGPLWCGHKQLGRPLWRLGRPPPAAGGGTLELETFFLTVHIPRRHCVGGG